MKTTLEIPDTVFRGAKARAAEQKVPLRQFVSEAVVEKLEDKSPTRDRIKTKLVGRLRHLRKEAARINARIEDEFESVGPQGA